jgi:hypothetical protein
MENDLLMGRPMGSPDPAYRQTVTTTFKLTEDCVEILERLKSDWKLPTKDVLDQMGDMFFPIFFVDESGKIVENLDRSIMELVQEPSKAVKERGIRKAFVVSRGFLRRVNEISAKCKLDRDGLVQGLILETYENNKMWQENNKAKCSQAIEALKKVNSAADIAEKELGALFADDPTGAFSAALERFGGIRTAIWLLLNDIKDYMETGKRIDND